MHQWLLTAPNSNFLIITFLPYIMVPETVHQPVHPLHLFSMVNVSTMALPLRVRDCCYSPYQQWRGPHGHLHDFILKSSWDHSHYDLAKIGFPRSRAWDEGPWESVLLGWGEWGEQVGQGRELNKDVSGPRRLCSQRLPDEYQNTPGDLGLLVWAVY